MQKSKIREDARDTPLIYFRNYSFIIILFISAAMAVVGGGGNDMLNEEGNTPPLEIPCGNPIPLDEHACSVSLPKWSDVVGYEEGNVAVTSKMVCGYPRFVFHPYVVRLMEVVIEMEKQKGDEQGLLSCRAQEDVDCLLLPSYEAACRAHDFLRKAVLLQGTMSTTTTTATASSSYSDNALQHTLTSSCNINDNHHHHLGSILRIRSLQIPSNVHALIFPAETKFAMAAKAYWQHTGEIVSSRRAEAALAELGYSTSSEPSTSTAKEAVACPSGYPCLHPAFLPSSGEPNHTTTTSTTTIHTLLKQRIASITNTCPKSCVYLFPTGMAAIYAALRSARRHGMSLGQPSPKSHLNPQNTTSYTTTLHRYPHCGGGTSIVFGFPYLDTLKLCGRPEICPDGVEFFGHGDTCDLQNLELMLQQRRQKNGLTGSTICALLTEFPSNPLLNCHDLSQLRALADQYNFILIVDDTISNFSNIDLISSGIADVICTSLTKLWNGRGDAMGGSMVINPNTPRGRWMIQDMEVNHDDDGILFTSDARALYQNSQDFIQRSNQVNRTAELLADWLYEHPDVQQVYYPKFTQPHFYQQFLNVKATTTPTTTTPGFGGLLSIVLEPHMCQRTFYDNLHVCKGPSLGTNFTLVCPYTLLAHYHELEFARAYHVSPNLLRVAVGLEDFTTLQKRFDQAFAVARLHPKLKPIQHTQRGYCTFSSTYQGTKYLPQKRTSTTLSVVQKVGFQPQPSFLSFSPYFLSANLRPSSASCIVNFLRNRRVI